MVKDKQVQLLRLKMAEGKTIEAAAAAADMSVRSAHNWKTGPLPSQTKKHRHWRTRQDPFEGVWEADVVPLLERAEVRASRREPLAPALPRDELAERDIRSPSTSERASSAQSSESQPTQGTSPTRPGMFSVVLPSVPVCSSRALSSRFPPSEQVRPGSTSGEPYANPYKFRPIK